MSHAASPRAMLGKQNLHGVQHSCMLGVSEQKAWRERALQCERRKPGPIEFSVQLDSAGPHKAREKKNGSLTIGLDCEWCAH
jgi:hypothetical protein